MHAVGRGASYRRSESRNCLAAFIDASMVNLPAAVLINPTVVAAASYASLEGGEEGCLSIQHVRRPVFHRGRLPFARRDFFAALEFISAILQPGVRQQSLSLDPKADSPQTAPSRSSNIFARITVAWGCEHKVSKDSSLP